MVLLGAAWFKCLVKGLQVNLATFCLLNQVVTGCVKGDDQWAVSRYLVSVSINKQTNFMASPCYLHFNVCLFLIIKMIVSSNESSSVFVLDPMIFNCPAGINGFV